MKLTLPGSGQQAIESLFTEGQILEFKAQGSSQAKTSTDFLHVQGPAHSDGNST